jgi:regulator of replication initiation timing
MATNKNAKKRRSYGGVVDRMKDIQKEVTKALGGDDKGKKETQQSASDDTRDKQIRETVQNLQTQLGESTAAVSDMESEVRDLRKQLRAERAENRKLKSETRTARAERKKVMPKKTMLKRAVAQPDDGKLDVGDKAWVRKEGGKNLNLRDGAGIGTTVIGSLPPGTELELKAGPQPADNYTWWHVRVSDGREGWVAGEELVTQPE